MGRWLAVHVAAWGMRGWRGSTGLDDDETAQALRHAFPHRDSAWVWEVIGDAHLLNDRKQVKRECRAQRKARVRA